MTNAQAPSSHHMGAVPSTLLLAAFQPWLDSSPHPPFPLLLIRADHVIFPGAGELFSVMVGTLAVQRLCKLK